MDHVLEGRSDTLPSGKRITIMFCSRCDGTPGKRFGDAQIVRTLTSECPGTKLTREQEDEIGDGKIDFKNGEWIRKL